MEKENENTGETEIEIETLLTNLPENIMTTDDICEIYNQKMGNRNQQQHTKKQTLHRKLHRKKTHNHRTRHLLQILKIQHILPLQNIFKLNNKQKKKKKKE